MEEWSSQQRMRLACLAVALALSACGGQGETEPAADEDGITIALPPAKPAANGSADATNVAEPAVLAAPAQEEPAPPAPPQAKEKQAPEPAEVTPAEAPAEGDSDEAPAAPAPAPEPATAVRAPLPPATMASTIRRIGYRCPSVVSSEEAGGGYRITCSSGEVYRGTRRQGRFFFRPWQER